MSQGLSRKGVINRFAKKLRHERNRRNISQVTLSIRAGFTPSYISSLERSEKDIKLSSIERIAKALKMSMSDLMEF